MHSDIYRGVTGPARPRIIGADAALGAGYGCDMPEEVSPVSPFTSLDNALNRLQAAVGVTIENASRLVGPWPIAGSRDGEDKLQQSGLFAALTANAAFVHMLCDRLDEANRAVAERLP